MKLMNLGRTGLFIVLFVVCHVFTFANEKDYSSAVRVKAIGSGKVYANSSSTPPSVASYLSEMTTPAQTEKAQSAPSHTYYIFAKANDNNVFAGWYTDENCTNRFMYSGSVSVTAAENTNTVSYYAKFIDYAFASMSNGVNFAGLIINPTADQAITTGWTATNIVQNTDNKVFQFQHWVSGVENGTMSQTISNVPNGLYEISVDYAGVWNNITLSANGNSSVQGAGNEASKTMKARGIVTDGTLTIQLDIQKTGTDNPEHDHWCNIGNFTLTYLGEIPSDYIQTGNYSGYIYTVTSDGKQIAFGKGAAYGTQATCTNAEGLNLSVSVANTIAKIKYADNQYLGNDGGDNMWVDRNDNNIEFYMQNTSNGYKFIYANDVTKGLGYADDVIKLVDVANAAEWNFADDKALLKVKANAYGTFVAPYEVTVPTDVSAYKVSKVTENLVTLTTNSATISGGTPVILKNDSEELISQTYYGKSATGTATSGALTGFYEDGTAFTSGYVLQDQGEGQKFYKVNGSFTGTKNRCYLNCASYGAKLMIYIEAEDATTIEEIDNGSMAVEYFSINGVKLDESQKGVNIVRLSDGTVKKIFIK